VALLVSAEIDGRLKAHCEASYIAHLLTIGTAAVVLAPRGFLSVPEKVCARDVMVMADLGTAQPREK